MMSTAVYVRQRVCLRKLWAGCGAWTLASVASTVPRWLIVSAGSSASPTCWFRVLVSRAGSG
ncbi:MAG: hypothetical protein Ta2A_00390 [Treponemataceae bacterium]|nr:MAG: hypothetical protein Ta2A_00390 [Treponemataceae bacterium]